MHTEGFAADTLVFSVRFRSVGFLSPDCFACFPEFSGELKFNYRKYHRLHDEKADQWTSLRGGQYRPHVSLYGAESPIEDEAAEAVRRRFQPFSGEIVSLALSWVREDGFEILSRYPLRKELRL